MGIYKTNGIILKRKDFGEADKLVTIFTDSEGKINVKAKGIRWLLSKNKGHLELFNYSDLMIAEGKEIDTVASAFTLESFKRIKEDLKKTAVAFYLAELCDKLIPFKEKNKKIFDLLLESLRHLDRDEKPKILTRYFELNLLATLGFKPEVNLCVHCRKQLLPIFNFFSSKLGGVCCPSCCQKFDPKSLKISKKALSTLRLLLSYNLETVLRFKIDKETEREVEGISENFLKYVAEKKFKSPRFLQEIENE